MSFIISTPAPPYDEDDNDRPGGFGNDGGVSVSSEVMVASVAFFFFVVVLVFFLHIYAKWRWAPLSVAHRAQSRRLVFGPDYDLAPRRGLDPAVLNSLPVHVFVAKDSEDGIECAVCLSEIAEGEKARLLPKCNHGFHLECIDMWFASHSTCPLCRNPVRLQQHELDPDAAETTTTTTLPANVLFYGDRQDLVSGAGGGVTVPAGESTQQNQSASVVSESLVVDMPPRVPDEINGKLPAAEAATTTPLTARLRSFKRMLSREKRVVAGCSVCDSCSNADDVEQGISGEATPTKVCEV